MTAFYWYRYIIKLYIINTISFFVFIILIIKGKLFKNRDNGIRILVYHSIIKVPKNKDTLRITVPPDLFQKQITYLISLGYRIVSIDDLLDYMSTNKSINGKKIVLTFDDGFDDNFNYSYNILKKNELTATYFLVCNYIGIEKVFPWCDNNPVYSKPIAWGKISKMVSDSMVIGSHTLTHINLGNISYDTVRLYEEIRVSKEVLEDKLKIPVHYFSYPWGCKGSYNKITEEIIKKCGYKAACVNISGVNKKNDNIFELKRTRIDWNDTLFKFKMKIAGAYDWVDRLRIFHNANN